MNDAKTEHQTEVLNSLNLGIKGASWDSKPQSLEEIPPFKPYEWIKHNGKFLAEDHQSNRDAYMTHLKNQVHLPSTYALYDAQPHRNLLDVQAEASGLPRNIKGTTDVVVAKSEDVTNDAVRHNVVALLELKKINNLGNHEPQICLELCAAAILNPETPVLTCYTDLNGRWVFYWFGLVNVSARVAIKKLVLTRHIACSKLAKYLLDRITTKTDAAPETLPESFINRLSWRQVQVQLRSAAPGGPHTAGNDSDEKQSGNQSGGGKNPFKRDRNDDNDDPGDPDTSKGTHKKKHQKSEASGSNLASGLRLLCPQDDVADELDLLDMVDEDARTRTVRQFIAKHVIPHLTGAYPEDLSIDIAEEKDAPSFLSASNLAQHDRLTL